jgi:hypothetical protein
VLGLQHICIGGLTGKISAGPASYNDNYFVSEDAGTSYFNVLANDSSKAKLYSLDNNNVNQRAGYQRRQITVSAAAIVMTARPPNT